MHNHREYEKTLACLIRLLRAMRNNRALEPGQTEDIIAATKRLRHGLRVRNLREVEAAINNLARTCLR